MGRTLSLRVVGAALALVFAVVFPGRAEAHWKKAVNDNFIVYSEGSAQSTLKAANQLEKFNALLRALIGSQSLPRAESPLPVYLIGSYRQLRTVDPSLDRDILGFYAATPGMIAAVAIRYGTEGLQAQTILFHEYAHHFMRQYVSVAYPAWYTEGFAEYVSTAEFSGDEIKVGNFTNARAQTVLYRPWIPFKRLMTERASEMRRDDRAMFYAQSWLLAHYLSTDPERVALFNTYLKKLAGSADEWKTFSEVFGMDEGQLRAALKAYLRKLPILILSGAQLKSSEAHIEAMPESADNLLLPDLSAAYGEKYDDSARILTKVEKEATLFPDDAFAKHALANAEITFGDPQKALSTLGPIKGLAGDSEGLYLYGFAHFVLWFRGQANADKHVREARNAFALAFKIDPNHYQTLYRYAETFMRQPGEPSDDIFNVLLRAYQLAPQVAEIGLNTARLLMRRKRYDDAIAVLKPIANDPHSGYVDVAQKMLAEARSRKAPSKDWFQLPAINHTFGEPH